MELKETEQEALIRVYEQFVKNQIAIINPYLEEIVSAVRVHLLPLSET